MKFIRFLFIAMVFPVSLYAQRADSLLAVLDTIQGEGKVKVYNELFREHLNSDPVLALEYTQKAYQLAIEINDQRGKAAALNNIGVAYKNQGALDKALSFYINSLTIYTDLNNLEGIATTKNNISTLYAMKKNYGEAMKYLEESYKTFVELGDPVKIVGSMNNLGILYSDLQLHERAMNYFSDAYKLSEEIGQKFSDPLTNIGNIYFQQRNYQRAIEKYQQALEIQREQNDLLGMLNGLTNIGIAFTRARQPKEAATYLEGARVLATELNSFTVMPSIYKHQAEGYYQMGDPAEAYRTLLRYDSAREKVYGEESSRNIAQLEMALKLQEKEREFEILQKQDEIMGLQLRNSRLFIVTVILILLVLLAGANFYFMSRKKNILKS